AEALRIQANEVMAAAFDQVDFIVAATNPGPAFAADAATSSSDAGFVDWARTSDVARYALQAALFGVRLATTVVPGLPAALLAQAGARFRELINMGALTIISNIYG